MASIPAKTLWSLESSVIEEVINKNIQVWTPNLSPTFAKIKAGQFRVVRESIGRDMKILKAYTSAMGGILEEGGPKNDFTLYGDPLNGGMARVMTGGPVSTFPDPFRGPTGRSYRLGIPLRSMLFSIGMTLDEEDSESNPAFIREILAPRMIGAAKNISMTMAIKFFLDPKKNYSLTTFKTSTSAADDTVDLFGQGVDAVLKVTVDNLAISRFYTGQRLQIRKDSSGVPGTALSDLITWDDSAATTQDEADAIWFVQAVNPMKNLVYLSAEGNTTPSAIVTGGGGSTLQNGTTYHLVNAVSFGSNAYSQDTARPASIASIFGWLKTGQDASDTWGTGSYEDNFLLGHEADPANLINVKVDPMFMSYSKDMKNAPLTEHQLRLILRSWNRAKTFPYNQKIDTILASDGVIMAYEAQKIHREIIDRTNRLPSLAQEGDATDNFRFTIDGQTYTIMTEPYLESNTVLGLKLNGGNFKIAIPPRASGHGSFPGSGEATIMDFIPFRLLTPRLLDSPGKAWAPYYKTNSSGAALLTLGRQAVGDIQMQIIPEQPAGLILRNVAEQRIYAD